MIAQKSVFARENVENSGDLIWLKYLIESLSDAPLMRKLEKVRAKGRDDFPIRAMWRELPEQKQLSA